VVDDEERIRHGCEAVLTKEGYEVTLAADGEAGLALMQEQHYDVALLDLMMPSLSGLEVLAEVRESRPDLVVIVITGYATIEHSIESMKKGAFDFIPKPFTPDQLRVVVAKALEHTRALQDIATEQSRMRVLINRLSDGVLATDINKQVALCNPAFRRLLNYDGPAPLGCQLDELAPPEPLRRLIDESLAITPPDFSELTTEIHLPLAEAGVPPGKETAPAETGDEGPTKDPEEPERILAVRCVPFRDRPDRNIGTITVLQDVTAHKKLEQQKSDFVSMVAHEIRSPMSSVLMQLNALRDGLAGELTEKQLEITGRASARIQSLVDLASELLDLSRIEAGLIAQGREQLDPAERIREQVEHHRNLAEAKSITLQAALPEALPPILFNRQSFDEVLSNLITNAIKYTPEGGTVEVSARPEGSELRLAVRDTGFGLSPEDQAQIFRRFYRVKNAQTRFITGTGLGLPIVKQILAAHDARIHVESTEGEGSTFIVHLPTEP
jgi:signal transduction histidine kinase